MQNVQSSQSRIRYLSQVLLGLFLLILEVGLALLLPDLPMGETARLAVIVALVLSMLLQVQWIRWIYGRADELQQLMHRQACARSLVWLAAASGILGLLQANGLVPAFNQFWMLAALVALWGVQLMWADRPHH